MDQRRQRKTGNQERFAEMDAKEINIGAGFRLIEQTCSLTGEVWSFRVESHDPVNICGLKIKDLAELLIPCIHFHKFSQAAGRRP
jgi:hypothetical protein